MKKRKMKGNMLKFGKKLISILALLAIVSTSFTVPVSADEDDPLVDETQTNDDGTIRVEIEVPGSWSAGSFDVQVDGVPVSYERAESDNTYRLEVGENTKLVTAILYNGDISDSRNYPKNMRVYEVGTREEQTGEEIDISEETGETEETTDTETVYHADHIEALDDVLEYVGFSIRAQSATVKSGMRFSSSILSSVRDNGVETENYVYTVEEYGNIHILSRNWTDESRNNMTFNNEDAIKGRCFVRGSMDKIIRRDNEGEDDERIVFANTLTDIRDFNVNKNFRSYIKLSRRAKETRSAGEDIYLYGPSAGRSPYYIASKLVERGTERNRGILAYSNTIINTVEGGEMRSIEGAATIPENNNSNGNGNTGNTGENGNTGSSGENGTGNANGTGNTGGTATGSNPVTAPAPNNKVRALFLGDSVMLGTELKAGKTRGRGLRRNLSTDYVETHATSDLISSALANELGKEVECKLLGNSGATYSRPGVNNHYVQKLVTDAITEYEIEGADPDYIFLLAGVNDWIYLDQGEGELGNTAVFGNPSTSGPTEHSYCGGIVKCLSLLTSNHPNAHIMVCSPLPAWMYSGYGSETINQGTGRTLKQYAQAQSDVVDRFRGNGKTNVHFVNLYDKTLVEMGLPDRTPNPGTETNNFLNFFPDGYHPSQAAYEIVRNVVIEDMKDLGIL